MFLKVGWCGGHGVIFGQNFQFFKIFWKHVSRPKNTLEVDFEGQINILGHLGWSGRRSNFDHFWPFYIEILRIFKIDPFCKLPPFGSQKSWFRRKLSSHSDALFQLFFEPLRSLGPDLLRFCLSSLNSSLMPDLSYPRNRKNRLFQHFGQKWVSIWILPYNTLGGSRGRFDPQNWFLRRF